MASREASDLAAQLLGMKSPYDASSSRQYGVGMESVKAFYANNKKSVMIGGAVVLGLVAVGGVWWMYKKSKDAPKTA